MKNICGTNYVGIEVGGVEIGFSQFSFNKFHSIFSSPPFKQDESPELLMNPILTKGGDEEIKGNLSKENDGNPSPVGAM